MIEKTGGPAFPQTYKTCKPHMVGMDLRDYFAAKAMQGYLASYPLESEPVKFATAIARDCYLLADAMLEARSKS